MAGIAALLNAGMRFYAKDELSNKIEGIGKKLGLFQVATLGAFEQVANGVRKGGAASGMALIATGIAAQEAYRTVGNASARLIGVTQDVISSAAELEAELRMFSVISNKSGESVDDLRQKIIEFTTPLPTSATEVARAASAFAKMGFAVNATTDQMIRMSFEAIKFGRAIGVSDQQAAMFIGRLSTWLGVAEPTPEKMEEIASVVTRLGWVIKGQATDVIRATERFGAFVRAMGATEAQTLALAALVQDSGILIRRGSTAINRTFQLMSINARSFGVAVARAGVVASSADFERLFATDPVEAFNKVLIMLNKSSGQQATILLKQLGLHGNYISDLITMSRNQERWNKTIRPASEDELVNVRAGIGATTKAFEQMRGTFQMTMVTFKGAIENIKILLGTPLLDPIRAVITGFAHLLEIVVGLGGPWANIIGYALLSITIFAALIKYVVMATRAINILKTAQMATTAGFLWWIFVLAAVAAALLVLAAIVTYFYKKSKGEQTTFVSEVASNARKVKDATTTAAGALTGGMMGPGASVAGAAALPGGAALELPGAQKGGVFLQPTPVVVAEREPEGVVPLEQLSAFLGNMRGGATASAGGGSLRVTTPLYLDGMMVAEAVSSQMDIDRIRRGG